ncbi:MAG: 2-hydroxyacyl-CoA dehydratase [Nitrospinae bacterium]|nr:2-hydroxyacyl-CoA dehydratase [Nitrospinota bacterium]
MRRVGITTTIPAEFIFAAGGVPVDLNNIFIADAAPMGMLERAERGGLPRAVCGWIKGMYGAALAANVESVIAVSDGDCSHTRSLAEILGTEGVKSIPFAYPYDRDYGLLKRQMDKLAAFFGITFADAEAMMRRMDRIRKKLHRIDEMTWRENTVTGFENHLFLVSASDMDGDMERFEQKVDAFMAEAAAREPLPQTIRLAYIGVPPIFTDIYQFLETRGARVIFNEVQRQFTFPFETGDLVERYRRYTYPYDVFSRVRDIEAEISRRGVHGVVHYVQSFCHHQMEDVVFRKHLAGLPLLTVEGDAPGPLDARTRLRIEGFCEMLGSKRRKAAS